MRRREFIAFFGSAAVWPIAARAQQSGKLPTIGFLGAGTPSTWSVWIAAFVERLHQLGWIEGRTVAIEYRWAEGRSERFPEIGGEFVRLNVDVIVTAGTAPVLAVMQSTTTIPIVFATAGDPVGTGLVKSLARPGGNVTGLSNQAFDTVSKRVDLLAEVVPNLRRLATLGNAGSPIVVLVMREVQTAAQKLGIEDATFDFRRAEDIEARFAAFRNSAEALYIVNDPLASTLRPYINALALGARLPTMHEVRDDVKAGGLMSYGPNFPDQYRRAAEIVDKILRGAKPVDIPVEQPTKFDLVLNQKTAKTLGIAIPPTLLARADEVIE